MEIFYFMDVMLLNIALAKHLLRLWLNLRVLMWPPLQMQLVQVI